MLTWEQIKPYLELNGALPRAEILHPFYHKSIKYKDEMIEMFAEEYPSWMNKSRPRESEEHKKYRKDIYSNPIKPIESRIFGYIKAIRNSADYSIRYAEENVSEENTFKRYVTQDFGIDGSLENIIWNDCIDLMKFDPNGVICFIPEESTDQTKRRDVKGKLLGCENVWQLKRGEFAVIESDEKVPLPNQYYETEFTGKVLYFFDNESYTIAKQTNVFSQNNSTFYSWEILGIDQEFGTFTPLLHYCEGLPVMKIGRVLKEQIFSKRYEYFVSELDPIISNLKSAIRRKSDHEVEAINSITTLHWRMATGDCKICSGTGTVLEINESNFPEKTVCKNCGGNGKDIPRTNLDVTVVSTDKINDGLMNGDKIVNPIIPPGGSVQNSPTNLIAMRDEFERETANAFSGLGLGTFNYLAFSQSGVAKREDKEEGIRFIINMAEHICNNLLNWAFWCVGSIRFGINGNQLNLMPSINIPKRFNLDTIDEVRGQLAEAIDKKMDSGVIDTYQLKLLKLEAGVESLEYKRYHLRMLLDGYRSMSEQQKWFAIGNLAVLGDRKSESYLNAVKSYQFSINFDKIYQDAILKYDIFDELSTVEKEKIMIEISTKYETIKPAEEPIEQLTQNPPVNVTNLTQV